jgi:hypothetical protein
LLELRDALREERLNEDQASILEDMDRLAALRAQQQQSMQGKIDRDSPYFGHLVVDDDHGRRSVLIGKETFLSDRVRIVDWRNAPISRIFYQYAEGDEYDLEIADRDVSGEVLVRRTLAIAGGELRRVGTDDATWVRGATGAWEGTCGRGRARLAGGGGLGGAAVEPRDRRGQREAGQAPARHRVALGPGAVQPDHPARRGRRRHPGVRGQRQDDGGPAPHRVSGVQVAGDLPAGADDGRRVLSRAGVVHLAGAAGAGRRRCSGGAIRRVGGAGAARALSRAARGVRRGHAGGSSAASRRTRRRCACSTKWGGSGGARTRCWSSRRR